MILNLDLVCCRDISLTASMIAEKICGGALKAVEQRKFEELNQSLRQEKDV